MDGLLMLKVTMPLSSFSIKMALSYELAVVNNLFAILIIIVF